MRLAVLPPSRGLIRRLAIAHARGNMERFVESLRSEHDATLAIPEGTPAEAVPLSWSQAETGAIVASLGDAEKLNDQQRAMPPYDARAVIAAACDFLATDLRGAGEVKLYLGASIVAGFEPWTRSEIAEAVAAERDRLAAGGEIGPW